MSDSRTWIAGGIALLFCGSFALPADGAPRRKPKPKPVCNLLTDAVDRPESPSLDITSADVATGPTSLTWVIRVPDLSSSADPQTAFGRRWGFAFSVGTKQVNTGLTDGALGPQDGSAKGATVVVDTTKNEVRYTVPFAKLNTDHGVVIVPGVTKLGGLKAQTSGVIQPSDSTLQLNLPGNDQADSTREYVAGRPSCIGPVP